MPNDSKPSVIAARALANVLLIDGGHTIAVELETATGGTMHVLLPMRVAADLARRLAGTTGEPPSAAEGSL